MGGGRFMVTVDARGPAVGKQDAEAVKAANDYCSAHGGQAVIEDVHRSGYAIGANPVSAAVTFTCAPNEVAPTH